MHSEHVLLLLPWQAKSRLTARLHYSAYLPCRQTRLKIIWYLMTFDCGSWEDVPQPGGDSEEVEEVAGSQTADDEI